MLNARIIPVLLVRNKGLVKTLKFTDEKYVGDPINAVRIFNEMESDELVLLDIDASAESREPDYKLIENIASECRMPLCYGGGIKTVQQAERILQLGVEKVSISSAVYDRPEIISELAERVGRQSVVVCLDVKKRLLGGKVDCYSLNGTLKQNVDSIEFAKKMEEYGAGELFLNFIDCDGVMKGYDLNTIAKFKDAMSIPITAVGGAGSHDDIHKLIAQEKLIGAAVGSLFVFKGKYRAVLINYPTRAEKQLILNTEQN